MGFNFRKSMRFGPFRVTASKSGLSYSAGARDARVTRRADGEVQETFKIPGTHWRYTKARGREHPKHKR